MFISEIVIIDQLNFFVEIADNRRPFPASQSEATQENLWSLTAILTKSRIDYANPRSSTLNRFVVMLLQNLNESYDIISISSYLCRRRTRCASPSIFWHNTPRSSDDFTPRSQGSSVSERPRQMTSNRWPISNVSSKKRWGKYSPRNIHKVLLCFILTHLPWTNARLFTDDILRCIFVNEKFCISVKFLLKFAPKAPIDNNRVLVQIMAWCRPGDKTLSDPMTVSLLTHIGVTWPQWIKGTLRQMRRIYNSNYIPHYFAGYRRSCDKPHFRNTVFKK